MKTLVIYHSNCTDGLAAAVAHRIAYERGDHSKSALDKFDYLPMGYDKLGNEEAFFEIVGKYQEVWFLDFCPTEPLLRKMLDDGKTVTILDHHKSAFEMIKEKFNEVNNQLRVIFSTDNKLSGATLTWLIGLTNFTINQNSKLREIVIHDHTLLTNVKIGFIKEDTIKLKDPLYNLIGIRDTWDLSDLRMKEKADALHAYFDFAGLRDFEKFYTFVKREEFVFRGASLVAIGENILEINRRNCEVALDNAFKTTIETEEGPIEFAMGIAPDGQGSQFGESWRLRNPGKKTIAIALFLNFAKRTVVLGARSSGIDALRLIQSFPGGGGHPNACGCNLTETHITIPFKPEADETYTNVSAIHIPQEFITSLIDQMVRRIRLVYQTTEVVQTLFEDID